MLWCGRPASAGEGGAAIQQLRRRKLAGAFIFHLKFRKHGSRSTIRWRLNLALLPITRVREASRTYQQHKERQNASRVARTRHHKTRFARGGQGDSRTLPEVV
jgi:hypothetical protein